MPDRYHTAVSALVRHLDLDSPQLCSGQPASGQPALIPRPGRYPAAVDVARHDHALTLILECRQDVGLDPVDVRAFVQLADGVDWQTDTMHESVLHVADARVASHCAARNQGLRVLVAGVVDHQHGHVQFGSRQVKGAFHSVARHPIAGVVDFRPGNRVGKELSRIVDGVGAIRDVVEHHQAGRGQALHESVRYRLVHVDQTDSRRVNRGRLHLLGDDLGLIVEQNSCGVRSSQAGSGRLAVTQHPATLGFAWSLAHRRGRHIIELGAGSALPSGTAVAAQRQNRPKPKDQDRHHF